MKVVLAAGDELQCLPCKLVFIRLRVHDEMVFEGLDAQLEHGHHPVVAINGLKFSLIIFVNSFIREQHSDDERLVLKHTNTCDRIFDGANSIISDRSIAL